MMISFNRLLLSLTHCQQGRPRCCCFVSTLIAAVAVVIILTLSTTTTTSSTSLIWVDAFVISSFTARTRVPTRTRAPHVVDASSLLLSSSSSTSSSSPRWLYSALFSTTNEEQQQQEQQASSSSSSSPPPPNMSTMEQLAREWSTMNRGLDEKESSVSSNSIPLMHDEKKEEEDKESVVLQQHQQQHMDQLAREWTSRNRGSNNNNKKRDEPFLELPENAMANLPPQLQRPPLSFLGGTSSSSSSNPNKIHNIRGKQPQQPPSQPHYSSSQPTMDSTTLSTRMTTTTTTSTTTRDTDTDKIMEENESSSSTNDKNNKFVLVGKDGLRRNIDQDPELNLLLSEELVWKYLRKEQSSLSLFFPLSLLVDRTWDTIEDILIHLRRIPYEKGWIDLPIQQEKSRKTIVVLGSGWAAHALMKVADCNKLRLLIVSPSNHFVFTPMLASAAVGTVEYRSMTEAVRAANPMIYEYIEGAATSVNLQDHTVMVQLNPLSEVAKDEQDILNENNNKEQQNDKVTTTATTEKKKKTTTTTATITTGPPMLQLKYDHLVVAVGSRVDDRGIPGADKCLRLKTTDDAKRLRTAIGQSLEYASRPQITNQERCRRVTIVIVGGGPTGVELAGELSDLFVDVTRPHKGTYPKLLNSYQVILIHGGPDLVPQFESNLRLEALLSLQKKGVDVILNTRVTKVDTTMVHLSTKVLDPITGIPTKERTEKTIPMGLTVWCAGTAPVPFVEQLLQQLPKEARNRDGRIKVDRWMRPMMTTNEKMDNNKDDDTTTTKNDNVLGSVLVVGDAAAVCDEQGGEDQLLPATAQVAGQQGAFVARLLDRNYNLTMTPPQLNHDHDQNVSSILLAHDDDESFNVFDDPALNIWLHFRGLDVAPGFGFLNLGMLAYLGGGEALSQIQVGNIPILSWAGSVAFVLWRSVYLVKQVATRNRVLVTFDWIKSALFGRDTTRL